MSDSKIFIPELWEPKIEDKLGNFAQKSELNHFILKNTDINMNDHTLQNVKNSGSNDAVNKSYVDNAINYVHNRIPFQYLIKESVTGSTSAVKTIDKSIVDPILNGLKTENIWYSVRGDYIPTLETILNFSAKIYNIQNNTLNVRIRIRNEKMTPWDLPVVVCVYIMVFESTPTTTTTIRSADGLEHSDTSNSISINMPSSYF